MAREDRVLTIPNLISAVRLLLVPVFLWLLLAEDQRIAAGILLAVQGATDWVDGYIARHFDQGSELGKVLDPVADRVLLIAAAIGLTIDGVVPPWLGIVVLARELIISVAVLALAAAGAARVDVQWSGKAGTLAIMFGFPLFLLADEWGHPLAYLAAWTFTIGGLILGCQAVVQYIPLARDALRRGRKLEAR